MHYKQDYLIWYEGEKMGLCRKSSQHPNSCWRIYQDRKALRWPSVAPTDQHRPERHGVMRRGKSSPLVPYLNNQLVEIFQILEMLLATDTDRMGIGTKYTLDKSGSAVVGTALVKPLLHTLIFSRGAGKQVKDYLLKKHFEMHYVLHWNMVLWGMSRRK